MFNGRRRNLVKISLLLLFGLSFYNSSSSIQKSSLNVFNKLNDQSLEKIHDPCLHGKTLTNGAFCLHKNDEYFGGVGYIDAWLCRNIENLIGYSSVADFGAGLGQYGRCFLRTLKYKKSNPSDAEDVELYKNAINEALTDSNILRLPQVIRSYEAYDGSLNIEIITHRFVKNLDLSTSFDLGRKFDWVLSLEVGEHIPKEAEEMFFRNLIHHSCKGIILSWAIPGQQGLAHINNQPNEYIISKMEGNGFTHDIAGQTLLRSKLTFYYFFNTVMVFRRRIPLC